MKSAPQHRFTRPITPCRRTKTATLTTFRINTCKSVSKHRTLTPSRMNTYEKPGGRGVVKPARDGPRPLHLPRCFLQGLKPVFLAAVAWGLKSPPPKDLNSAIAAAIHFFRRERTRASSVMGTKSPGLRQV